jgi:hypothetical protein
MDRGAAGEKPASWTARILTPLALLVVALVTVVIVTGSLDGDGEEENGRERERISQSPGCEPEAPDAVENGYYVIQPGEPGLSSVASRTCVPLERIERLNEDLDPQAIPPLACIDLRRDGCKALAEQS